MQILRGCALYREGGSYKKEKRGKAALLFSEHYNAFFSELIFT